MNSKRISLIAFLLAASVSTFGTALYAQSRMTDRQVLEYVKAGVAEGKSQDDMIKELATKGVDRTQAQRVKALYESEMKNQEDTPAIPEDGKPQTQVHKLRGKVSTIYEYDTNADDKLNKKS